MARIRVNLTGVEAGGPKLSPGRYVAELVDCNEEESSSGNPMLVWEWEVVEGDSAGMTIKSWTSLQEHALFGLKGHLKAFGIDDDDVDIDTDRLIGRKVLLTVGERSYKDRETGEQRTTSSVKYVDPYGSGGKKAAKPARGKAARGKTRGADEEIDEEDLPF